ncbi:glycerol-3-phosphate responsive antiterminator [Salipaludibacillus daqingensis]|uniref:glycerol-3-phosphate responsive antiterminator n=1 Tax=Salipaludibacillus daqingensis TaxID=3041001 RepID=UPI0024762E86|nr:glycerol-3-phosphate responsive antiterminator [Salipaludibacillus daqingensis]
MKLEQQRIIPTVRNQMECMEAVNRGAEYVILLHSDINELVSLQKLIKRRKTTKLFVHMDLIKGLSNDGEGVGFLHRYINPYGVVSTHPHIIKECRQKGMVTIQRFFLFDEMSVERCFKNVEKGNPDMIELLPGLIPEWITEIRKNTKKPILTGGLIKTEFDVQKALDSGALAITTSEQKLWNYTIIQPAVAVR